MNIKEMLEAGRDSIQLPQCPDCNGMLMWAGKEFGGGIMCVGQVQPDKEDWFVNPTAGCGFRGYVDSIEKPIIIKPLLTETEK
jgi:hypothetical protein